MKRIISFFLIVSLFVITSEVLAWDRQQLGKLKRGAINVISSPLEMPHQIKKTLREGSEKSKNPIGQAVEGIFKGAGFFIWRLATGLWDVATFNVEIPAGYAPVFEPEYIFDKE